MKTKVILYGLGEKTNEGSHWASAINKALAENDGIMGGGKMVWSPDEYETQDNCHKPLTTKEPIVKKNVEGLRKLRELQQRLKKFQLNSYNDRSFKKGNLICVRKWNMC